MSTIEQQSWTTSASHLLELGPNGRTLESAGPISWGYRLESSQSPEAWHHIIYEKGAWVMHMLRRKMGDDRFLAMLRALPQRYQYKAINTEQFRLEFAAEVSSCRHTQRIKICRHSSTPGCMERESRC